MERTLNQVLLDKSILDEYRLGSDKAVSLITQIIFGKIDASISSATVLEIWMDPVFDRRMEIGFAGLLEFLREIPFDNNCAKKAGYLLRTHNSMGFGIAAVLATADCHDLGVLVGESNGVPDDFDIVMRYEDVVKIQS